MHAEMMLKHQEKASLSENEGEWWIHMSQPGSSSGKQQGISAHR